MDKVIATEKIPIKLWLDNIEEGALQQAKNLANLPFAFKHIAIMPDAHQGYGMPIGGVMATRGVVVPNAVGVDIGCGMCAVKTSLTEIDVETIKKILGGSKNYHGGIRSCIPVGFNHHSKKQDESFMPADNNWLNDMFVVRQEYSSALKQIGTLGGGNHFIEIQKGSDGHIWIMIHSGSRNLGYKVAKHYNEVAVKINEKYFSQVPKEWGLAFLPLDSEEATDYLREMNYCVRFALANRELMMAEVKNHIYNTTKKGCSFTEEVNIAHNYATMESHFGRNVMVHRKGATLAREGTIGIIPGSQGTASYIVEGLGNPMSFNSCSHGAGRRMGRNEAKKKLDLEEEIKKLDDQGIVHSVRSENDLDEASGAYKDIDVVMKNQEDLVKIKVELHPLAVVKG